MQPTHKIRLNPLLLVGLSLFILLSGCFKTKYEEIPPDLPDVANLAPIDTADFGWQYSTLTGETKAFSRHRGKVILLNFWATWCGPCKVEMPKLQALYNQMQNRDVDFLLISNERPGTLTSFLSEHGFDLPVYQAGQDAFQKFGVEALPTTFIIDQNGRIVFKHIGAAKWDDDSVIRFLADLQKS